MGKKNKETNAFLKKPVAPKIIITASSDDSPDLDHLDNDKRFNGDYDRKDSKDTPPRSAPPDGDAQVTDAQAQKNWFFALFLLLLYIALVVMTAQLTKSSFGTYKAPFLFIWCKVSLRILAFPSVFLIQTLIKLCRGQPLGADAVWEHCTKTLRNEEGRISLRLLMRKFFPMSIMMLLMQVCWVVGLVYAPASIVSALFAATIAFSYLLSWLVLKNKMLLVKGIFVIVAFVGLALISYATTILPGSACSTVPNALDVPVVNSSVVIPEAPIGNMTIEPAPAPCEESLVWVGVLCGICGALFYSLHQLAFKMAYPTADLIQVAFIMTCMSCFICLMYFPVPVTMHFTGREVWDVSRIPWGLNFAAWTGAYISSISYAYGLALSNPFFMSVAEVLIVALNTGIDTLVREIQLNMMQIVGTALVVLSFVFMVMPDGWITVKLKKSGTNRSDSKPVKTRNNNDALPELEALNRPSANR